MVGQRKTGFQIAVRIVGNLLVAFELLHSISARESEVSVSPHFDILNAIKDEMCVMRRDDMRRNGYCAAGYR